MVPCSRGYALQQRGWHSVSLDPHYSPKWQVRGKLQSFWIPRVSINLRMLHRWLTFRRTWDWIPGWGCWVSARYTRNPTPGSSCEGEPFCIIPILALILSLEFATNFEKTASRGAELRVLIPASNENRGRILRFLRWKTRAGFAVWEPISAYSLFSCLWEKNTENVMGHLWSIDMNSTLISTAKVQMAIE